MSAILSSFPFYAKRLASYLNPYLPITTHQTPTRSDHSPWLTNDAGLWCEGVPRKWKLSHREFYRRIWMLIKKKCTYSTSNWVRRYYLYYKCCMWIEFQSISTWLRGFSPGTPVSSLLKIDSQSNPSGNGAVLQSHIWIVFRGRAPRRQHSSFGPTSLSCALCNSVYRMRERVISRSSSPLQ